MSSREPMWYCHECHAEMRPLMVPDPQCASCHGSFVEKIENDADDPRSFRETGPAFEDGSGFGGGPGLDFFMGLSQLINGGRPQRRNSGGSPSPDRAGGNGSGLRIEINRGGPGGTRTFVLGGPQTLGGARGGMGGDEQAPIGGQVMAQYLLAMLSQRAGRDGRNDPLGSNFAGGPEDGRWGDYVFNQDALDQIITQIMEQGNSSRPVAATEEVMQKLDREVLEEGSALLERDCAVCKEQFSLITEDPDEQVVVTLPCKHPFHQGCIIPWLKSSGTCPVCRHQLVPQPEHHPPNDAPSGSNSPPPPVNRGTRPDAQSGGGMFGQLFNIMSGGGNSGSNSRNGRDRSSSHEEREHEDVPGGWLD
ncbi:hypothetical protein BC834DRAFT_921255 [Gloeopeniophorella convolvens]|nr:hypothetical protein BC834DRAFT_921255 [Gloeopeniophorella convolvens]